tara:strand:+ start:114 stop:857 length:744 start_codon:yes stop_codon:yes gene_type:complete
MLGLGNDLVSSIKIFQPHDISDCVLALYAPHGVDDRDIGTVASWQDHSESHANGCFAYQGATGKRPAYNNSYITFDGANDRLDLHQSDLSTALEITLDTSDNGWTFYWIGTMSDWDGANQAIVGDPNDSLNFIRHRDDGEDVWDIKVNNTLYGTAMDDPAALVDGQYYAVMFTCAADGTITCFIDNTAQADTATISDTTDDFKVQQISAKGSAQHVDGSVKSLVVYDKILSAAERALINTWSQQYVG